MNLRDRYGRLRVWYYLTQWRLVRYFTRAWREDSLGNTITLTRQEAVEVLEVVQEVWPVDDSTLAEVEQKLLDFLYRG